MTRLITLLFGMVFLSANIHASEGQKIFEYTMETLSDTKTFLRCKNSITECPPQEILISKTCRIEDHFPICQEYKKDLGKIIRKSCKDIVERERKDKNYPFEIYTDTEDYQLCLIHTDELVLDILTQRSKQFGSICEEVPAACREKLPNLLWIYK